MKPDSSALAETLVSQVTRLAICRDPIRFGRKFLTCLFVLEKQRLEETSCLTSGLLAFCEWFFDPILQVSWCQNFGIAEFWDCRWANDLCSHEEWLTCSRPHSMSYNILYEGSFPPTGPWSINASLQHRLELSSWSVDDNQWERDHDIMKYFSLIHLGAVL